MPFAKGQGGRKKGSANKKTIWLLESLAEHGYDYEKMLTTFLGRAAKGDTHAYAMAQLLVKMVPYLANAPKQDAGINQIETLVINRYELPTQKQDVIEGELADGHDNVHEGTPSEDTVREGRPSQA